MAPGLAGLDPAAGVAAGVWVRREEEASLARESLRRSAAAAFPSMLLANSLLRLPARRRFSRTVVSDAGAPVVEEDAASSPPSAAAKDATAASAAALLGARAVSESPPSPALGNEGIANVAPMAPFALLPPLVDGDAGRGGPSACSCACRMSTCRRRSCKKH